MQPKAPWRRYSKLRRLSVRPLAGALAATTKQWRLAWSHDCASFGSSGDLSVDITGRPGDGPTDQDYNDNGPATQGLDGSGVDTFYDTGTFNFQVWANCNWTLEGIR
jgi:hypothetical protein